MRTEPPVIRTDSPVIRTQRPFFSSLFFFEKIGLNFENLTQKNEIRLDLGAEKLFSAVFRSISTLIWL